MNAVKASGTEEPAAKWMVSDGNIEVKWVKIIITAMITWLSVGTCGGRVLASDRSLPAPSQSAVDEELYASIGGLEQWVTIKGENRNNPVVLVLHGGPGAALTPFDDSAFAEWRQKFTVVQWD